MTIPSWIRTTSEWTGFGRNNRSGGWQDVGLTITTFSTPCVRDGAGEPVALPEKAILAIAYLLTRTPAKIGRADLAAFLWGDDDGGDPLANLRQLLVRTRQKQEATGVALLVSRGQEVFLDQQSLASDIAELEAVDHDDPVQTLRIYLACVTGEFLKGCRTASMNAVLWLEAERNRHLGAFARALETVAGRSTAGEHAALIREAASRLLALDPYNESAYRSLLALHSLTGDDAQARILRLRFQDRLTDELGLVPASPRQGREERTDGTVRGIEMRPQTGVPTTHLPRLLLVPPETASSQDGRLASALIDDITISLCRARSVSVIAPHTARRIATTTGDRSDIYLKHDVAYALEARLDARNGGTTLVATLADIAGDNLVWAERFDLGGGLLPKIYSDLVQRIVSVTTEQIERHEFRKIGLAAPPDAYQHYLLGQHHLRRIDLPNLRRARKFFRSAISEAPRLSNALSGLARAEHLEWLVTARGDRELLRSAERHAQAAIDADCANAGGYHQLGVVRLYDGAFDESLSVFCEAEQIAPSHADLVADYADTLVHASEPDRALEKIERAIELNPLCPDVYWWTAAGTNYCLGRFETALAHIGRMEDQSATTRLAAACWGMLGDLKQARRLVRRTMEIYPDFEVETWLSIMPVKENWQKEQYREGLRKAGFQ